LYSAYVRGEALSATHRYAEAAPSFRRFSIIEESWARILSAHSRTCNWAETFALSGDKDQGEVAYQISSRWKDADPDSPDSQQAKAEYAKLPVMFAVAPSDPQLVY
jgi:hypothetical protein